MDKCAKKLQELLGSNYTITIECTEQAATETLLPLLDYLKKNAGIGHSFPIVVDPGDSDYEKKFYMDGDGAAHIISIKDSKIE